MTDLIGSDGLLSPEAEETLRSLAGTIIPESAEHGVPGADDAAIFADILASAGPMLAFLNGSMQLLDALSGASRFPDQEPAARLELAERFRTLHPEATGLAVALICQCYYRDERVTASLGMVPRPPFPEGFEVKDGDWSLLDPVRARGKIYREVT